MNTFTAKAFTDRHTTNALLRTGTETRRQADELLREIAFVLKMTSRVREEIVESANAAGFKHGGPIRFKTQDHCPLLIREDGLALD